MKFSINEATTMPYDFEADITAYAKAGIYSVELWLDKVEVFLTDHDISEAKALLNKFQIEVVSACAVGGLMVGSPLNDIGILKEFKKRLNFCRELGSSILVVPTDFPKEVEPGMYRLTERNLHLAGKIAADYNVKLAIEFIQGCKFLSCLSTAKEIVRGASHPNVGLVIDLAHFWMGRSHLEDIADLKASEIFLLHINDIEKNVNNELVTDYHRTFPCQGRGIEKHIIPHILDTGFNGFYSLEIFNRNIWGWPIDKICQDAVQSFSCMEEFFHERKEGK